LPHQAFNDLPLDVAFLKPNEINGLDFHGKAFCENSRLSSLANPWLAAVHKFQFAPQPEPGQGAAALNLWRSSPTVGLVSPFSSSCPEKSALSA